MMRCCISVGKVSSLGVNVAMKIDATAQVYYRGGRAQGVKATKSKDAGTDAQNPEQAAALLFLARGHRKHFHSQGMYKIPGQSRRIAMCCGAVYGLPAATS